MLKNQELYLYKNQSSGAYTELNATTDAATLAGTDLIEPLKDSDIAPDIQGDAVEIVAGPFDQDAWVPGAIAAKGNLKFPMNPAQNSTPGATTPGTVAPHWSKVLTGMCDFYETVTSTTKFSYVPVSVNSVAGLIKRYYGSTAASSSITDILFNLKAEWKISFQANKYPTIEFAAVGAFAGQTESETQPSITKARNTPFALKGATITVGGVTLKVISGEISGSQTQAQRVDPSETYGMGQTDTTDRKIKFKFKAYSALSTSMLTNLKAQTEGTTTVQWGPTGKVVQITGAYGQFSNLTKSDENGVTTWDIEGQFNRNSLSININP